MVSLICIGFESTSCSLDPDLAYQSVHHQVLIQSNGNIYHCYIKLMDYQVISTLDCWRCTWYSALNNIGVLMTILTCPILLLRRRHFKTYLIYTNQIHLIGEYFDIHGDCYQ